MRLVCSQVEGIQTSKVAGCLAGQHWLKKKHGKRQQTKAWTFVDTALLRFVAEYQLADCDIQNLIRTLIRARSVLQNTAEDAKRLIPPPTSRFKRTPCPRSRGLDSSLHFSQTEFRVAGEAAASDRQLNDLIIKLLNARRRLQLQPSEVSLRYR